MATPTTCAPPQSCPTRSTGSRKRSNRATNHSRYPETVAAKPLGSGTPKPGGDSAIASSRSSSPSRDAQTAALSGLPCTSTSGVFLAIERSSLPHHYLLLADTCLSTHILLDRPAPRKCVVGPPRALPGPLDGVTRCRRASPCSRLR